MNNDLLRSIVIAIIYCRVSTKGQLNGGGLNSQEVACRQYCERMGYKVIEVFNDSFTGGDLDRPGINALFEFIDKTNKENPNNPITKFIVDDISRIARDYKVHIELTTGLKRRGVSPETVNMKFEDTPAGSMIEGIMAIHAEYFRKDNQARVISRQEARLIDGYRPWDYPLGYKTAKAPVGGKILIREEPNASIIQEALMGYANGLFNSLHEVASFLENKGLDLSRSNKRKKYDNKVHPSLAGRMLNNILYAGHIEYKKVTRDKNGIIKKNWNISLREGKHEGLIDIEAYYKIQEKLTGKRPYTHEKKTVNDEYPLRGHVACTCCGLLFTTGKSRSRNGSQIPYYQFNKQCIHKGKSVSADKLHLRIDEDIKNIGVDVKLLQFMKNLILKEHEERKKDKKLNITYIDKEVKDIEDKVNNLIDSLSNTGSLVVQKAIEQKIESLERVRKDVVRKRSSLKKEIDVSDVLKVGFEILENPYYIWKNGTIDEKQTLLRLLLNKKILIDFSTRTYGTLPFSAMFLPYEAIFDKESCHLEMAGIEPASKRHK